METDYKKLYEQAFGKIKDLYDNYDEIYCLIDMKQEFEKAFPELKESEDERIRKELINYFKYGVLTPEHPERKLIESWIAWIEKQGEQKFVDKVEPKFHEGEWLCENEPNNYARFIQILEIVNVQGKDRYRISRDIHNDEDIVEFDFVEKYYHKFDIKRDAKDGDMLVTKEDNRPFIFKGLLDSNNPNCPVAYCGIDSVNLFLISPGIHWWSDEEVCPATKEQRDQLEKAMRDAGYRWNKEELKLEKI